MSFVHRMETYESLISRLHALPYAQTAWPQRKSNRGQALGPMAHRIEELREHAVTIGEHAADAAPLAHARIVSLLDAWLEHKRANGSSVERELYARMDAPGLVDRLLTERPLVFFKAHDEYVLRSGDTGSGGAGPEGGFALVGTADEQPPLLLARTLSYDELALSALLSLSTPTLFVNDGERGNQGRPGAPGSFERAGVYTGCVGPRFEQCEQMEWRHCIVSAEQNTAANGYGAEGAAAGTARAALLRVWARLYGVDHFASYEEARAAAAAPAAQADADQLIHQPPRFVELAMVRHGHPGRAKFLDTLVSGSGIVTFSADT